MTTNLKLTSLITIITLATTMTTTLTACGNAHNTETDTPSQVQDTEQTTKKNNNDSNEPFAHIKEGEAVENPENFTINGQPASKSKIGQQSSSHATEDGLEHNSASSIADEIAMEALMMADEIEGAEEDSIEVTEESSK